MSDGRRARAGGRGADRGQRWPGWGLAGLLAHLAARWRGYAVDETLDMVLPGANREAQRPGRLFEQCAAVRREGVGLCDHPRRERLGEINRGEELGCKIGLKLGRGHKASKFQACTTKYGHGPRGHGNGGPVVRSQITDWKHQNHPPYCQRDRTRATMQPRAKYSK